MCILDTLIKYVPSWPTTYVLGKVQLKGFQPSLEKCRLIIYVHTRMYNDLIGARKTLGGRKKTENLPACPKNNMPQN